LTLCSINFYPIVESGQTLKLPCAGQILPEYLAKLVQHAKMQTQNTVMTKTMSSQRNTRFNVSWKYVRDKN